MSGVGGVWGGEIEGEIGTGANQRLGSGFFFGTGVGRIRSILVQIRNYVDERQQ